MIHSVRITLALCAAVLLLNAVSGAAAAQEERPRQQIEQLRTLDSGQPAPAIAPAPAQIDARILTGIASVLVVGLLLLLYFYRRRLFILYWVASWSLGALATLVAAYPYPGTRGGHSAYGISQFLRIVSALVLVISADAYRSRPVLGRGHAVVLLPVFLWFSIAPINMGPVAAFAPGHLVAAGALAAAGLAHLTLLRYSRLLGAAVIGVSLLVVAALNVWIALTVARPDDPVLTQAAFFSLALGLATALGMQLMTFEDMTYELRRTNRRLESAQSELREMVTTDALTGVRNRRFFDEVIGREVQRHRRYNIPLSMLFVDVDRFKAINDTLGHEAGDRVLQQVAGFLIRNVREADYVFRWGGDEFLILISCREPEAVRKGKELKTAFARSSDAADLPPGVGLSIGCAEVPQDATNIHALVGVADERMYVDKRKER
jgi:diguanylate cyclase (GGDEF)-like protein